MKKKNKKHYCAVDETRTPCGRLWKWKLGTSPIPDLRSITCELCKRWILKMRIRRILGRRY